MLWSGAHPAVRNPIEMGKYNPILNNHNSSSTTKVNRQLITKHVRQGQESKGAEARK